MKEKFIIHRKGAKEGESPYEFVEITHIFRKNHLFLRHAGKLWPVVKIDNKLIGKRPYWTIDDLEQGCTVYALPKMKAFGKSPLKTEPLDIKTIERVDHFNDELQTNAIYKIITVEGTEFTIISSKRRLYIEIEKDARSLIHYPVIEARLGHSSVKGGHVSDDWLRPAAQLTFNMAKIGTRRGTLPPIKKVRKLSTHEAILHQGAF